MTIEVPGEKHYLKRGLMSTIDNTSEIINRKMYEPLTLSDIARKPSQKL